MSLPHQLIASRTSLEEYSRSRAAGVFYGDGLVLCRVLGEFPLFISTQDCGIGPRLVLDGFWESWVTLALARYLKAGMYCVDVGCNYGYYTALMAAAVGPEGRVLACDVLPVCTHQLLPMTVEVNGFRDRVTIQRVAVADREAPAAEFLFDRRLFGSSGLPDVVDDLDHIAHEAVRCQVPMATLDELVADWHRLDVVKIDVEGAESLVWQGMQRTLRRFPQVAVLVELHTATNVRRTIDWLEFVELAGYTLRQITYEGEILPLSQATTLLDRIQHNMLWIQR